MQFNIFHNKEKTFRVSFFHNALGPERCGNNFKIEKQAMLPERM